MASGHHDIVQLDSYENDVTFELDNGEKVPCQKQVLARASPLLKAMFTHDDRPVYKMKETDFKLIYQWAYHNYLPQKVNLEDLKSADYFLAEELLAGCIEAFWTTASKLELTQLMEFVVNTDSLMSKHVTAYMARHFDDVNLWLTEFTQLPCNMVLWILQSDYFYISSESFLWFVLKSWAKADLHNRKKQLTELADHIKFLTLSTEEFCRVVAELAEMTDIHFNKDLFDAMYDALICSGCLKKAIYNVLRNHQYEFLTHCQSEKFSAVEKYFSPRIPSRVVLGQYYNHYTAYPESEGKLNMYLEKCVYMVPGLDPPPMRDFGTAVVDKTIYLLGGKSTLGNQLKTVVSLDLENTQEGWKTMPQMKVARKSPSATVAQGKIYVFGGSVDVPLSTIVLASCEVYDPNTKHWEHISDMGQKRKSAAVAVHNGKIFVTGGFDGQRRLDSAEMFDTSTNQWTPLPNMSHARMNHVSVIHQGKLYVSRGSRVEPWAVKPWDRRSGVVVNGEWIDPIWDELDLDNINKGWGKSWTRLAPSRRLAPPEAHTVEVDMTESLRKLLSPKEKI